jgi:hypothetical protein
MLRVQRCQDRFVLLRRRPCEMRVYISTRAVRRAKHVGSMSDTQDRQKDTPTVNKRRASSYKRMVTQIGTGRPGVLACFLGEGVDSSSTFPLRPCLRLEAGLVRNSTFSAENLAHRCFFL